MGEGLTFKRYFSEGKNVYDISNFRKTDAVVRDDSGNIIESLDDVVAPTGWSQHSVNTVATKYFRKEGVPETGREIDVRQLVHRVAGTIKKWGIQQGYFNEGNAENFYNELSYLCLNQYGAFNSPVWFNMGLHDEYGISHPSDNFHVNLETGEPVGTENFYEYPLVSACFIKSPEDSIEGMMDVGALTSSKIFKGGSGIGGDWSRVRAAGESVSGGGEASGAKRFMDVQDSVGRVIKSGGRSRRAATMQSILVSHPDIIEIIQHKYVAEEKGKVQVYAGSPSNWESHTWQDLRAQNVNISVRVTDEFMNAVKNDVAFQLRNVQDGAVRREIPARNLLEIIAYATHQCGDPGIQYHDQINRWNTCSNSGTIDASNPCSEYMFLDGSACNLASLNLMKFRREDGTFDNEAFKEAINIFLTAQDIIVSMASYPTEEIALNSHEFRPLGLGYANLGALIMANGLHYDSSEARSLAATITSNMTAQAYLHSTRMAEKLGSFKHFEKNKKPILDVMEKHKEAIKNRHRKSPLEELLNEAIGTWEEAIESAKSRGVRNAQVTLLAPTGTIGYMMGCDTTGCEPEFSLIKYKELSGGGSMRIANLIVPKSLERLGYSKQKIGEIMKYIEENGTVEGCDIIEEKHLPVFDCAATPENGTRAISPEGHISLIGAIQPHLSGAISKTINTPRNTSVEEIMDMYLLGHNLGLKALSIYRDGSKGAQPLKTHSQKAKQILVRGEREKLPNVRSGITQKVKLGGNSIFLTTGEYPDGRLGELFVNCLERTSDINRLTNLAVVEFSEKLQWGVSLKEALEAFGKAGKSQIGGLTDHPFIKDASSIEGFIYDWISAHYLGDISMVKREEEMRPLPWELRAYQNVPKLHLIPTIAGEKMYSGVPSLEETIKKISGTNYWKDEGLDTRQTIDKIKKTRIWKSEEDSEETNSGKITGQICTECGNLMEPDGGCWKCTHCRSSTGGCGGG